MHMFSEAKTSSAVSLVIGCAMRQKLDRSSAEADSTLPQVSFCAHHALGGLCSRGDHTT
jgi:hypothetical protein